MKPAWSSTNFWIAAIFGVACAAVGVVFALALGRSMDAAIEGNVNRLFIAVGVALATIVVGYVADILCNIFALKYAKAAMERSKSSLYSSTLKGFESNVEDNIAMYTTNTDIVYGGFYLTKLMMVYLIAQFAFSVFGVIYLDWRLFLVSFTASLLPIIAPLIFQKRLTQQLEAYSQKSKEYIDNVTDTMNGRFEIKSFFAQSFFQKRHDKLNKETEKARAAHTFTSTLLGTTSGTFGSLTFIFILAMGGYFVVQGHITAGALIAVVQLLNGMVGPIAGVAAAMGEMVAAKKIAGQYFVEHQERGGIDAPPFANCISIKNVTFTYPMAEKPAIQDLSIEFKKGRSYAIVGESGCGKSTLVKIAAGILPYDSGNVMYDNIEVKDANPDLYGMKVRYINQDAYLFNLGVKDNTELGHSTGNYAGLLENLGLAEVLNRNDIEDNESSEHLSAGQKQRIVLARALNRLPHVLILDEPTANMDTDTAINIVKYLMTYNDLTLIVITHADNKNLLELFDEVINM